MWLRTMISVGLSLVRRNFLYAFSSASVSLASGQRMTFQPRPLKRVATSSLKASSVLPSIVMWLSS